MVWATGPTRERRCPDDESLTVGDAFIQEQARLLALPGDAFATDEVKAVSAGKITCVRFDRNDYSIPHDCVSRTLTVAADLATVRILDGQTVIATHPRSFDRQQQIENPEHVKALVEYERAAGAHRGADQLITLIPAGRDLVTQATERGEPLGRTARVLNELLAAYGLAELTAAIADALARGVPHPKGRTYRSRRYAASRSRSQEGGARRCRTGIAGHLTYDLNGRFAIAISLGERPLLLSRPSAMGSRLPTRVLG